MQRDYCESWLCHAALLLAASRAFRIARALLMWTLLQPGGRNRAPWSVVGKGPCKASHHRSGHVLDTLWCLHAAHLLRWCRYWPKLNFRWQARQQYCKPGSGTNSMSHATLRCRLKNSVPATIAFETSTPPSQSSHSTSPESARAQPHHGTALLLRQMHRW